MRGRRPGAARARRAARTWPAGCARRRGPVRHGGGERVGQRLRAEEQPAGLVDLADPHPGPSAAVPASSGIRPSSACSRVDLPEPLAPVMATRSAQSTWGSTGPRVNDPRRTTAPGSEATTAPERGAAAISIRSSHSLRGSSTTSSRSIRRSVCRALAACFSLDSARSLRPILSLSVALRRALRTPSSIQLRCIRARSSSPETRVGVLLVVLPGVPAGHLALGQVGLVAAAVDPDLLLGQVQLDDPGHRAGQELPVVADHHRRGAQPGDEPLQPLQPVQVQVVGRLVEQQHVVAGEQQRGQPGPGRLPAGQRGHRRVQRRRPGRRRRRLTGPLVQVGAAEREPALQRGGVGVVGARLARAERLGGGVHGLLGGGHPGAPGQELGHRLAGAALAAPAAGARRWRPAG